MWRGGQRGAVGFGGGCGGGGAGHGRLGGPGAGVGVWGGGWWVGGGGGRGVPYMARCGRGGPGSGLRRPVGWSGRWHGTCSRWPGRRRHRTSPTPAIGGSACS